MASSDVFFIFSLINSDSRYLQRLLICSRSLFSSAFFFFSFSAPISLVFSGFFLIIFWSWLLPVPSWFLGLFKFRVILGDYILLLIKFQMFFPINQSTNQPIQSTNQHQNVFDSYFQKQSFKLYQNQFKNLTHLHLWSLTSHLNFIHPSNLLQYFVSPHLHCFDCSFDLQTLLIDLQHHYLICFIPLWLWTLLLRTHLARLLRLCFKLCHCSSSKNQEWSAHRHIITHFILLLFHLHFTHFRFDTFSPQFCLLFWSKSSIVFSLLIDTIGLVCLLHKLRFLLIFCFQFDTNLPFQFCFKYLQKVFH